MSGMGWFFLFFGIIVISTALKSFSNRKWKLLYTAFGSDNYMKITSKLHEDGVKYKTETPINLRVRNDYSDYTQYDIYVKKDEEHKAVRALHK